MTGEELQARLLYRDAMMLVLDKPAGLPVHAGPKGGQSLEQLFDALRFGLPRAPALAHRLDKDTSGCLVLGRHRKALARLGELFKAGRIAKTYWAVVEGGPEADAGLIDLPLATKEPGRGWWMKVDAAGLPSQTRFRVRGRVAVRRWRGWSLSRSPAAPTSSASIARRWASRSSAMRFTARRRSFRWPAAASPRPRHLGAVQDRRGARQRHRAGAGPHARGLGGLRGRGLIYTVSEI